MTDEQKENVKREADDRNYYTLDNTDTLFDDQRNGDCIGENEILVVSFGTTYNDSCVKDIAGIEKAVEKAYPLWSVRRAFTSRIIINRLRDRDKKSIDSVDSALRRAADNNVKNLVILPTHLIHGIEYDQMMESIGKYADKFKNVVVAEPLLGEEGDGVDSLNKDKAAVAEAVVEDIVKKAGYFSLKDAQKDKTAIVLLGHGTSHSAKVSYSQMRTQIEALGYSNVFIGTVTGEPDETKRREVIDAVCKAGYTKVVFRPLMVVGGDHANNDMADADYKESWFSKFMDSKYFDDVRCQVAGIGRIKAIQQIYVDHIKAVIDYGSENAGD